MKVHQFHKKARPDLMRLVEILRRGNLTATYMVAGYASGLLYRAPRHSVIIPIETDGLGAEMLELLSAAERMGDAALHELANQAETMVAEHPATPSAKIYRLTE